MHKFHARTHARMHARCYSKRPSLVHVRAGSTMWI